MVMSVNVIAFWDIASSSVVEVDQRFRCVYCLHHQGNDAGSTNPWNIGLLQQDHMVLYPRLLPSSSFIKW
jgi:hypothetical protein